MTTDASATVQDSELIRRYLNNLTPGDTVVINDEHGPLRVESIHEDGLILIDKTAVSSEVYRIGKISTQPTLYPIDENETIHITSLQVEQDEIITTLRADDVIDLDKVHTPEATVPPVVTTRSWTDHDSQRIINHHDTLGTCPNCSGTVITFQGSARCVRCGAQCDLHQWRLHHQSSEGTAANSFGGN